MWAGEVVDDPTNKSRRDLGANEADFGIFGQPPPPDGAVWRSNVQHFNGRCVLRSMLAVHSFNVGRTLVGSIPEAVPDEHCMAGCMSLALPLQGEGCCSRVAAVLCKGAIFMAHCKM